MKTKFIFRKAGQSGSGLLVTIFMTGIALATLAGALVWSMSSTRLNERSNQHARSVAAAEAVTEVVLGKITRDFKLGGAKEVEANSSSYSEIILSSTNPGIWAGWEFSNAQGESGKTYVDIGSFSTNYTELDSAYSNLMGFVAPVTIISNARLTNTVQEVVGAVKQSVQLASIPIFQFALFSSGDMEISCGQPFRVTGKVHANKWLYVEPDANSLMFMSDVTCGETNVFTRHPLDTRTPPSGSVVYIDESLKKNKMPALTLPIGTSNSPTAIREILQPPPSGEDVDSVLGRQRYYNLADMIITVAASGVTATTGVPFGMNTIPSGHVRRFAFASSTNYFTDAREGKIVRPLNIDVAKLVGWSKTNRTTFGSRDVSSIYVLDTRTLAADELAAVRVFNGTNLPPSGLTVATARPLYVQGNYNQTNALYLNTSNTTTTLPASLVADAITILSENWKDANSTNSDRIASETTVNAALLTGVVETTLGHYSGGMENFPRFLEDWNPDPLPKVIFTYNGSMVRMFPSQYATNAWRGDDYVYDPPERNWAYDLNFNYAAKLPPLTPCLQRVIRGRWTTLAPNSLNNPPSSL